MSTRRFHATYSTKQKMGSNGKLACLVCESDITEKRRSTFCCKACSDDFRLRTDASFVRFKVFERDKGICALCHKDVFENAKWGNERPRTRRARGTGDLWQADHIIPVVEGGGSCGLDNLRTLCTACHKSETAALAKRRALARRPTPLFESAEVSI